MKTEERQLNASGDEKEEEHIPARKSYKKPALTEYGDLAELTKGNGNQAPHDVHSSISFSGGAHAPIRFTPTHTP